MNTPRGWMSRPLAFALLLVCGVAVAIVLIEALWPSGGDYRATALRRYCASDRPRQRALSADHRDASDATLVIPHKPQRIVSQTLGTDEILLAITRYASWTLSVLADNPQYATHRTSAAVKERTSAGVSFCVLRSPGRHQDQHPHHRVRHCAKTTKLRHWSSRWSGPAPDSRQHTHRQATAARDLIRANQLYRGGGHAVRCHGTRCRRDQHRRRTRRHGFSQNQQRTTHRLESRGAHHQCRPTTPWKTRVPC